MAREAPEPLFRMYGDGEGRDPEVTEIESLCMNCQATGVTRLLLTRIPYYRNVVVMSFTCEGCGYQNNELQPGGPIGEQGIIWTLRVEFPDDLNRQVVKSDFTGVKIPCLDFEIPAHTQTGEITTVEGILERAIRGLSQDQDARLAEHPEDAARIHEFIEKLTALREGGGMPWTLELSDMTGNCFVENPEAPRRDPRAHSTTFVRTEAQDAMLGIYDPDDETPDDSDDSNSEDYPHINGIVLEPRATVVLTPPPGRRAVPVIPPVVDYPSAPDSPASLESPAAPASPAEPAAPAAPAEPAGSAEPAEPAAPEEGAGAAAPAEPGSGQDHLLSPAGPGAMPYEQLARDEVLLFRTNCPDCDAPCDTNMKMTNIPHFKEVVIMSTTCELCGHRTNEVKSGGGIEARGVRFELRLAGRDDFSRDVLKSETCSMEIPELELEVGGRALGGRFTTAEGLVSATVAQLRDAPGASGDAPGSGRERLERFLEKVEEVLRGERHVTIILDDPAGNSYVQSLADDPALPDAGLTVTRYERTFEQNEELGINDMKTEDYQPAA